MSQNNASNKPPASGKPRRTEIGGTRDLNSIPEDTEQPIAQEITEEILPGEDENQK